VKINPSSYILVSDRNRHVRNYLRRELIQEGYHVYEAKDAPEVMRLALSNRPLDLLVLDPELPYFSAVEIMAAVKARPTYVPIVVHAFDVEEMNRTLESIADAVVAKQGDNIDSLKHTIAELLKLGRERLSGATAKETG